MTRAIFLDLFKNKGNKRKNKENHEPHRSGQPLLG